MLNAMRVLKDLLEVLKSIDRKLGKIIANQETEMHLLDDIRRGHIT